MVFIKVFSVLLLAYIAPDRVMVRCLDRPVYRAIVGFQVGADQDIVYAEIEFVQIVGDPQSFAGLCECIVQLLSQDAMCERNGTIVEITAYDGCRVFTFGNDSRHGICL